MANNTNPWQISDEYFKEQSRLVNEQARMVDEQAREVDELIIRTQEQARINTANCIEQIDQLVIELRRLRLCRLSNPFFKTPVIKQAVNSISKNTMKKTPKFRIINIYIKGE